MRNCIPALAVFSFFVVVPRAHAQRAPEAGYIFPPGGKAGATINVHLGGYDWTPDMEFFVHDKRVQLMPSGPPGPMPVPGWCAWSGSPRLLGPW